MPSEAAEAGADQRLPPDGGGVHQKPGADEASGRETGGQPLLHMLHIWVKLLIKCYFSITIILVLSFITGGEVKGRRPAGHPHVCGHSGGNHR